MSLINTKIESVQETVISLTNDSSKIMNSLYTPEEGLISKVSDMDQDIDNVIRTQAH